MYTFQFVNVRAQIEKWWYVHIMRREISTEKQLGAFIHDARAHAGLTQEQLAISAGVSRKWLIGLEQGVRRGAELRKVLDVLAALQIEISLSVGSDGSNAQDDSAWGLGGSKFPPGVSQQTINALRRAELRQLTKSPGEGGSES